MFSKAKGVTVRPPDFLTASSALAGSKPMSIRTLRSEEAIILYLDARPGGDG